MVSWSLLRPNDMIVRALDGAKTVVLGEIDLKGLTGACEFDIPFVLIDIPTVFNLVLGLPWIYTTGALPSTLNFILGNKLILVMAEEEFIFSSSTYTPYIEAQPTANFPAITTLSS